MKRLMLCTLAGAALLGCPKSPEAKDAGPLMPVTRPKLPGPKTKVEPLDRVPAPIPVGGTAKDADYAVAAFALRGPRVPQDAVTVALKGDAATSSGAAFSAAGLTDDSRVVLVPEEDTYLAQAAPTLALLQDSKAEVFLKMPGLEVAVPVILRDELGYQAWMDELVPGKFRVIHRTDGFELQTNVGKLPGEDPRGPTVPVRGGSMDLATLQKGFGRIRGYFPSASDVCFVPTFGMPMNAIAQAMAANYDEAGEPNFESVCLVYPRPGQAVDGGKPVFEQ